MTEVHSLMMTEVHSLMMEQDLTRSLLENQHRRVMVMLVLLMRETRLALMLSVLLVKLRILVVLRRILVVLRRTLVVLRRTLVVLRRTLVVLRRTLVVLRRTLVVLGRILVDQREMTPVLLDLDPNDLLMANDSSCDDSMTD